MGCTARDESGPAPEPGALTSMLTSPLSGNSDAEGAPRDSIRSTTLTVLPSSEGQRANPTVHFSHDHDVEMAKQQLNKKKLILNTRVESFKGVFAIIKAAINIASNVSFVSHQHVFIHAEIPLHR